jgi:hypothetical protein
MNRPDDDATSSQWMRWACSRGRALKANLADAEALADLRELGINGNGETADAVAAHLPDGWAELDRSGNGSIYVTYEGPNDQTVKVRFADHGGCYCSEDVSCDPDGFTPVQVIEFLKNS